MYKISEKEISKNINGLKNDFFACLTAYNEKGIKYIPVFESEIEFNDFMSRSEEERTALVSKATIVNDCNFLCEPLVSEDPTNGQFAVQYATVNEIGNKALRRISNKYNIQYGRRKKTENDKLLFLDSRREYDFNKVKTTSRANAENISEDAIKEDNTVKLESKVGPQDKKSETQKSGKAPEVKEINKTTETNETKTELDKTDKKLEEKTLNNKNSEQEQQA